MRPYHHLLALVLASAITVVAVPPAIAGSLERVASVRPASGPDPEELVLRATSTNGDLAAFNELKSMAQKGNAYAQERLGALFQIGGPGIPVSYPASFAWSLKAAEQGNYNGAGDTDYDYSHGQGVLQDYCEALKWALIGKAIGQRLGGVLFPEMDDAAIVRDESHCSPTMVERERAEARTWWAAHSKG